MKSYKEICSRKSKYEEGEIIRLKNLNEEDNSRKSKEKKITR